MKSLKYIVCGITILILLLSCSSSTESGATDPVAPGTGSDQVLTTGREPDSGTSPTILWGIYDIYFDIKALEITAVPNRTIEYAVNVVGFLNNNPAKLAISFNGTDIGPGYVDVSLDVSITHPMDVSSFDGYDVRGIFIGEGSGILAHNSNHHFPEHATDQILLNADGYTRWWNPAEFTTPGFMGYIEGVLSTPDYTGTATLNPYKYFGEGLGSGDSLWDYLTGTGDSIGYFLAGTMNTRNYVVRFTFGTPGTKYNYAIVANWAGTAPDDHPAHATEAVGISLDWMGGVYYVDEISNGGALKFDAWIYDWGSSTLTTAVEDYTIIVESPVLSAPHVCTYDEMTPVESDGQAYKYSISIPADNVTNIDAFDVWVLVEYADADYTSPFGIPNDAATDPLTSAFRFSVEVQNTLPWLNVFAPNGGENWQAGISHEIFWEYADLFENVYIQYSKDDFVSDIHDIALDEECDGGYFWMVPDDPSTSVKVRIGSVSDPAVVDKSDGYFTIVEIPKITVTSPNGGEMWSVDTAHEITWDSSGITGNVFIQYSKDDFASDINDIALDEANDGSYIWDPVPLDVSQTVKVRISSTDIPTINDVSDDYFSITDTGWALSWADYSPETVVTDIDGNIYFSGHGYPASNPVFLFRKYNRYGQLIFERLLDFPSSDGFYARDLAIYNTDIYIAGIFRGTIDFDPLFPGGEHTSIGGIYTYNAYLLKLNAVGEYVDSVVWLAGWNHDLQADSMGNLFVCGSFEGTVDFDPDPTDVFDLTGPDGDAFLASFTSDLDFNWAVNWSGVGTDGASDLCIDESLGNVYVTGGFDGINQDFDPGPGTDFRDTNGNGDCFISCFDIMNGTYKNAVTWGGADWDVAYAITRTNSGLIYTGGAFMGTVDFDPGPGTDNRTAISNEDCFLSRFNPLLVFEDVVTFGGDNNDSIGDLATDDLGNIYTCGPFNSSEIDLDPSGGTDIRQLGVCSYDLFVTKFDSVFNYQWGHTLSCVSNYEDWTSIGTYRSDFVLVAGMIYNGLSEMAPIDPPCNNPSAIHGDVSGDTGYLLKYLPDGCWSY